MTAAAHNDAPWNDEVFDAIATTLLGPNPQSVTQCDISHLITAGFWDHFEQKFIIVLSVVLNERANVTAWNQSRSRVERYILSGQPGRAIAFGKRNEWETVAYLIVTPGGLAYRAPLTAEEMAAAVDQANRDETEMFEAMQGEVELLGFLANGHLAATCDLDEGDNRRLADIRRILWELEVRDWEPRERCEVIGHILALVTAIAKNSGYELEALLAEGRRHMQMHAYRGIPFA